jgi:hypothetical protein
MPMSEDDLLSAVKSIADELRSGLTAQLAALDEKCSSLSGAVDKMRADAAIIAKNQGMQNDMRRRADAGDPDNNDLAQQTAADSVGRSELAVLARSISDLQRKVSRPMTAADRNAMADAQAKADAVMRTLGTQAEPPMAGEDLVSYNIRLARKMQPHSAKWKGVELSIVAADSRAFENVLQEIRADAMAAGNNPIDLPLYQHREIVEESRGGHKITRFVGRGSIFAQLSRPVRHVTFIGTRSTHQHA